VAARARFATVINYDGHPDRDGREVEAWVTSTTCPYFDDQVHFPDLAIEYEDSDGRRDHRDVEVLTITTVARTARGSAIRLQLLPRIERPNRRSRRGRRRGVAVSAGLAEELLGER